MSDSDRGQRSQDLDAQYIPFLGVLLFGLLMAAIAFMGGRYLDYHYETTKEQQEAAAKAAYNACVAREPRVTAKCVDKEKVAQAANYSTQQDLKAQQQMAEFTFWMALASVAGVFIALAGVIYIRNTLLATKDAVVKTSEATEAMVEANDIARKNALTDQRPYVFFYRSEVGGGPGGRKYFSVFAKNFGRTPALNCTFAAVLRTIDYPVDPAADFTAGELETSNVTIGPGMEHEVTRWREGHEVEALDENTAFLMCSTVHYQYPETATEGGLDTASTQVFYHEAEIERGRGRPLRQRDFRAPNS